MPRQTGAAAIVAFTSPLRLVLRSSKDHWAPTLDDINHRTYDYVKLHRLRASLDIGLPSPLCLHVAFDGSLLLPKIDQFWPIEKSVSKFNEILGYILVGGIYFGRIEPPDVDQAVIYQTAYFRPLGLATGFVANLRRALQYKVASPLDSILLYNPKRLLAADFCMAFEEGKAICLKIPSLSPAFLVHGVSAFIINDWGASLSHLWIAAEQIVENLWRTRVVDGDLQPEPSISRRRVFLTDHRTWSTSTRMEVLFQKGILPARTYGLLDIARKARNDLVHTGQVPKRHAAAAALDGVFQLIALVSCADRIDYFTERLQEYKLLDPIERHYSPPRVEPTDAGDLWMGPFPAIPGEKEWGDKPYEDLFELNRKKDVGNDP